MSVYAVFKTEDFSTPVPTNHLSVRVINYSHHAIGGPDFATIEISGPQLSLWEAWRWLRYDVKIRDTNLGDVWWGYVAETTMYVPSEGIQLSLALDGMYNRVAVAYTLEDDKRRVTTYAQDDDSVTRYGKRETMKELDVTKTTRANRIRNKVLAQLKYPVKSIEISTPSENEEAKLVLTCRGYWETLSWQMYKQTAGKERHVNNKNQRHRAFQWGDVSNYVTYAAQSFQLGSTEPWYTDYVEVLASKRGTGGGNLVVEVRSDSSGVPNMTGGGLLASATILKEDIPEFTSFSWVRGTFSTNYELQTSTTYWLVFSGSASNSTANHLFIAGSKDLGYTRGISLMYLNGGWKYNIWNTPAAYNATYATQAQTDQSGNNYDTCFKIFGAWTTQKIITEALDTAQFLTYTFEGTATDLTYPEAIGDETILDVVETAMEAGTDDERRILSRVSASRVARIYPEPTQSEYEYQIAGGKLYDAYDQLVPWSKCPAGVWVKLKNLPPPGVTMASHETPRYVFIERMEYSVEDDRPGAIELRDAPSPWEMYEG